MEQSFFAAANDLDNVLDEFERNEDFQLGQSVDFATAKPAAPAQAPQTNAPGHRAPDSSLAGFYPVTTGDGARASPQYHPAALLQHPTGGAVYNGGHYSGGDSGMASFGAQSQVKEYPGQFNVNGPTGQLLGTSTASNYQSQAGLVNYQTTGAGTFHGYQGQPGMNTHQGPVAVNNLQEQQALSSYQTVAGQNSYSVQGGVNSFSTQPPMGSYQPHVGNSSFQAQAGLNSYPAAVGLNPHPLPGASQHPTVRQPDFQLPGPMLDSQVQSSVPSLNTQPSMSLHGGAYPSVGRSSSPPKPVNLTTTPEAQVPNSTAMVKPELYPMSAGLTQGVSSTGTSTIVDGGPGMYPSVPASTGLYPAADLTQPTVESNVVGLRGEGDGLYPQTAALTQMANISTESNVGITSSVKGGGLYPQTTGLQTTLGTGGVASMSPGVSGGEGTMYPSIGLAKPVTTNIQAQATADELVKYMMTSQILKKDRDTQPALSSGNPNVSFESAPITVNTMGEGGLQSAASLEVNLGGKPAPKAQISSLSNSRSGKTDLEDIVQDTGERRNVIAPTTGRNILGATEKENKGEGQKQGLENNMTANIVTKEDIGRKVENSQSTVTAINSRDRFPNVEQTVVLSDNKATIPLEQVAYKGQGTEESVVLADGKSSEPIHSKDAMKSDGDGNTDMTQNSKMASAPLKGNENMLGGATATGNVSVHKKEVEQTATEDLKMAENVDGVEQEKGGAQMIGFTPEAEVEEEFDDAEIDAYLGTEGVGLGNSGNESMAEAGSEDAGIPKSDAVLEQVMEKSSQEGPVTSVSQLPVTLFLPTSCGERKEQKSDQVLNNNEGKRHPEGGVTVVGELSDADPFFSTQTSTSPTDTITSMEEEEEERCRMSQAAAATSSVNSILDDRTIEQKAGNSETYVKEGLEERFQIESRKLSDIIANDGDLDEGIADTMATGRLDHGDGLRTVEDFSAPGLVGKNIEAAAWSEEKAGGTVNRTTETERMLGLPVDIKATVHQQGAGEREGGGNPEGQGSSASLDGAQSLSSAGAHYDEDGTNPSLQGTVTLGDNPGHSQQPPGHTQQPPGHTQQPNQTEAAVDGDRCMQTAVENMAISGQMEHDQQQQPITDYSEPWDTRQAPYQDMPQDGVRMPPHPPLGVASPEDVGFPPNVEMFRDDLSSVLPSDIGWEAPVWVPDEDAPNCMKCEAKFTFTKRRHHCRACGKVLCSACCSQKARLAYMDNKSARVCSTCYNILQRAQARGQIAGISQVTPSSGQASPNPNNPMEYCSTLPPMQQAQEALQRPPPSVLVPVGGRPQGALGVAQREGRHVRFSDGSIPGGDGTSDSSTPSTPSHPITSPQGAAAVRPRAAPNTSPQHKGSPSKTTETRARLSPSKNRGQHSERQSGSPRHGGSPRKTGSQRSPPRSRQSSRTKSLIPDEEDRLPPVILSIGDKGDYEVDSEPDPDRTLAEIKREETDPVMFLANPNLVVLVKVINLSCCVNRLCWCFSTRGMHTVSQDEVVILLEAMPDDDVIPRDIFAHLQMVYEEAGKGNTVGDLGHTIFNQPFLGSREHGGFLYIQPTFQCTQRLILPDPPYVVGVLLQKWETPWAKVFPIRLMLRLGAEFRYYPCPLFSVRFRKPVYCEIGHTIMNLLADFRNFQYMLGQVRGVVILLEDKRTLVRIPSNRYDDMMKVLNNCNEHVLSWGSNFSEEADSHLVCIQNDEGAYQTQAISIQNRQRKVTGASFIVFNGSLKTTAGLRGKSSIVEDGVMVQILPETMSELRQALRNMKDYTIGCGSTAAEEPDETVEVRWVEDDRKMNIGVTSPIDGQSMEGLTNIHVHSGMDFAGEHRTIRWTEVFFLQTEDSMPQCEPMELSRLAESIATATCVALVQHLDSLREAGMNKLGLRVNIDRDEVGYVAGSKGQFLPPLYMTDLDNELIPVIHNAAASNQDTPIRLELIFHILHNVD